MSYVPYSEVYSDSASRRDDRQQQYNHRSDHGHVQAMAAEDIEAVRNQQLHDFYRPAQRRDDYSRRDRDSHPRRDRSADDGYYSNRRRQRRDSYSSRSSSDSDSQDRRRDQQVARRRDQDSNGRRTQSEKRPEQHYDGDLKGVITRNLDTSSNGVMAAALGAGVGAIGARRFGGNHYDPKQGSQNWKTLAGAAVGGLVANAAENRWQKRKGKGLKYEDDVPS